MLLGALVLTGCASALAIRVHQAGPDTACITPAPARDVALSGGAGCGPPAGARSWSR